MNKITENNTNEPLWYLQNQHTLYSQSAPNHYAETKSYLSAQAHTCPCGTNGLNLNSNCILCQYRHYWMHTAGFAHSVWNEYAPTRTNPTCSSCPAQPASFTPGCVECAARINSQKPNQNYPDYCDPRTQKQLLKEAVWSNLCTYCHAPENLFTPGCHGCRTRARLLKNFKATSVLQSLTGVCDHSEECSINCVFCNLIQAGNTLIPNGEYRRLCHNHETAVPSSEETVTVEQGVIFESPVSFEDVRAWKPPKPNKRIPKIVYNPTKYVRQFPEAPHLMRPGRATRKLQRKPIPPLPPAGYCRSCGCDSTLYTEGCITCQNRHFAKWSRKQPTLYADWFNYQELTTVKHQVCSSCGTPMHLYQDGCNACFERYGLLPQNTLIIYPTPDDVIAFTKLRWEKSEKRAFKKISHLPM